MRSGGGCKFFLFGFLLEFFSHFDFPGCLFAGPAEPFGLGAILLFSLYKMHVF